MLSPRMRVASFNATMGSLSTQGVHPFPISDHTTSLIKDQLYLYGGTTDDVDSDRFYQLTGTAWREIKLKDAPKRSNHQTVAVESNLFVIGGLGPDLPPLLSAHSIDCSDPAAEEFPIKQLELNSKVGDARLGHTCTKVEGGRVLVYGGQKEDGALVEDHYWFDAEIELLSPLISMLPKTAHHTATYVGGKIYLFGGFNGTNYSNEISTFNPETGSLITLKPNAKYRSPAPRAGHCAVALPDNEILIYGGYSLEGTFTDFWIYKIDKKVWTCCVLPPASSPTLRSGRTLDRKSVV